MNDSRARKTGLKKSATRIALIAGSSIIYFGLAILAYGGVAAFFSHPARTAVALVGLATVIAAVFAGGNLSTGVREDRGNRWVLVAFGIIGLPSVWLPPWLETKGVWLLDGDTARWLGVTLYAVGGVLRLWPVYVLGNRFSGLVAIQPGHTLVTNGPYTYIRHPSYLGVIVIMLGWALVFRSGVGVLLTALILVPLIARIRAEENLLRSQFGEEYNAYCARTARLIPGVY